MKNLFWALAMILCYSPTLYSQAYIGASAGNSFINKSLEDTNSDDFKVDENAFGYKIFAGYGVKFIGIEGGYRDLGEVKTESNQTALVTSITGWDAALRGKLKLGPFFGFAKAGAFWAKAENEVGTRTYEEKSTNFLWGVGAGLQFGRLAFRAEYEGMGKEDNGLSMLTAGLAIELGKKEDK